MPSHTIVEVAEMMKREDVGLVPVVDGERLKLIGVITDRDIVMKVVAGGRDPNATAVSDVMTDGPVSALPQEPIDAIMEVMASQQIRRVPVVDDRGSLIGIVSQADIATRIANPVETGQVVQAISEPLPPAEAV